MISRTTYVQTKMLHTFVTVIMAGSTKSLNNLRVCHLKAHAARRDIILREGKLFHGTTVVGLQVLTINRVQMSYQCWNFVNINIQNILWDVPG